MKFRPAAGRDQQGDFRHMRLLAPSDAQALDSLETISICLAFQDVKHYQRLLTLLMSHTAGPLSILIYPRRHASPSTSSFPGFTFTCSYSFTSSVTPVFCRAPFAHFGGLTAHVSLFLVLDSKKKRRSTTMFRT